jgi:riboflavin synthase
MFSGIIEQLGRVEALSPLKGGARLRLRPDAREDWSLGESVSVAGACLTLALVSGESLEFDLGEETLRRTTLGGLKPGARVNLERALKVGDRISGHFVAGHVDGVGRLGALRRLGAGAEFDILAPAELMPLIAGKGSVAVEGVSLTPFAVGDGRFTVSLIPVTLEAR